MGDRLHRDFVLSLVRSPQHGIRLTYDPYALRRSYIFGLWTVLPSLEEGPHARSRAPTPGPEGLAAYWEHAQYAGVPAMVGLSKARRRVRCVACSMREHMH